ncbi:hypothetical protein GQ457_06G026970 [Hibiscus cannabinus]
MAPPDVSLELTDEGHSGEVQVFSNKRVNICLNESNFLLWKQQVVLTVRGLGLEDYLDGSISIPAKSIQNRSAVEHITTILNGLPIEYEPSIAAITASKESYSVENIVSILIDAESRMEDSSRFPIGINFTQANVKQGSLHKDGSDDMSNNEATYNPFVASNTPVAEEELATDNHSESEDVLQDHTVQDVHDNLPTTSSPVIVPNVEESGFTPRVDDADTIEHEVSNQSNDAEDIDPGVLNDLSQQVFSNKRVNICLNESNFLLWKQQVVLTVRGLGLEDYLDGSISIPAKSIQNRSGDEILNPLYFQYRKQDSSLASWLLSTISPSLLPQFVGSDTTADIWKAVTKRFATLSTTKIMNLHCRLRSMKKGSQSMYEYTMAIKQICDLLASCGSSISAVEHIATILNGLPIEYEPSIAAITASKESYSVENIVSILIDAESRMEDSSRFPVGINFTQTNVKQGSSHKDGSEDMSYNGSDSFKVVNNQTNRYKGRPRPQCQLCGKLGHLVDRCWRRFDQSFKGMSSQQNRNSSRVQANTCSCSHTTEATYNPFVASNTPVAEEELGADIQVNVLMVDGPMALSKWFPDSGATHHVTNNVATLQDRSAYSGNGKVQLGDGLNAGNDQPGRNKGNSIKELY